MYAEDIFQFSIRATIANRGRTMLMLLAMAIGVASVVVLISLGESARTYVTDQFASLGSNLLIVLPGRTETVGGPPPLLGTTPRDLTIEDAMALKHSPTIKKVSPLIVGAAPVSWQQRQREILVIGSTPEIFGMRHLSISQGRILPVTDPGRGTAVCVLGYKVARELFDAVSPLGKKIRLGERRFIIIGVMEEKGQSLGDDLGDSVVIPIASAQLLFNTSSLFRILIEASSEESIPKAKEAILAIIKTRHDNEDDITVITQDAILSTFDRIFKVLTYAVAGIAAISLVVAGILIMNVMLVAVSNRKAEIGLLKALGAPRHQIQQIFLTEAALLSLAGALFGLVIGISLIKLTAYLLPNYPVHLASWSPVIAIVVSLASGILFGVLPARQAASLTAADALSRR